MSKFETKLYDRLETVQVFLIIVLGIAFAIALAFEFTKIIFNLSN